MPQPKSLQESNLLMRPILAMSLALALAACGGGRADKDVTVVVAEGSSLKAAANQLEKVGAIDSASGFLRNATFERPAR